jgi:TolB-like protein/class 3 adenylate cyclase
MRVDTETNAGLEIGHVLFIDIVGYSKRTVDEQKELVTRLNELVRNTAQFRSADAAGKLIRIPTGDGMALAFFTSPDAPVNCAIELAKANQTGPKLELRMGIHSGPVDRLADVNERTNLAGAGMNMAQRVMDCGDAGHILLSQRIADDLAQYGRWRPMLHNLGEVELKHGVRLGIVSLHNGEFGNASIPARIKQAREEGAAFRHRAEKARRRRIILGAAAGALLLVSVGIGTWAWQRRVALTSAHNLNSALSVEKSIAVLPFENLSEEKENAFFAGGVQDEILTNLAKIADLKVISRTSVMKYKTGPERNLREIAKTLSVSYVVEGRVQRAGGRIRVSAQLIDARTDAHLWAEHYDRDFADIFAIQSEIAQQIADQLRSKLSPAERAAIADRSTADLVAYAYYTKAQQIDIYGDWEGGEQSAKQKVELLEKATQRDPNFALAYCALARTQIDLEDFELAKKAADAALRIRPDLGEAHLELARYYYFVGINTGDLDRARDELAFARRTLPNDSGAIVIGARIDKRQNRWDESLANIEKASELDPRSGEVAYHRRRTLIEMRRYKELEQVLAKDAAKGMIDGPWIQSELAALKLAEGDPVAAQALLAQVPLDFSPYGVIWNTRFTAALYLRDYDAANRVIAATPAKLADEAFDGQPPKSWADGQVARARGDKQKALAVFAAARKRLDAQWQIRFKDQPYFALGLFARLDAGLGRKEDAIREALQAVDLMPIAKDSYWGPGHVTDLALVYAWTGERDRALEQLEIVAKIPVGGGSSPTYGDLNFNPCWDSLRGDPRFEKIVASLAPKDVK